MASAALDLLETLRSIEQQAKRARELVALDKRVKGSTALRKIEEQASDALARAAAR